MDTLTRLLDAIEMMHRSGESSGVPEASMAWKEAGYPRPATALLDVAPPGTARIEVPIEVYSDGDFTVDEMCGERELGACTSHVVTISAFVPLPPAPIVVTGEVQP